MYTVFLAGGIASGKSTVARELERRGACRIDLDVVSREVLGARMPCTEAVAVAFGRDLLDPATGELDRHLLARRAFSSAEGGARLEAIELPYIRERLAQELAELDRTGSAPCAVVEVPLLDRVGDVATLADEVLCVTCPVATRRVRALGRGMDAADFDRRAALQPSEDYLRAHSDTQLSNDGDEDALLAQVDAWWRAREKDGWHGRGSSAGRRGVRGSER